MISEETSKRITSLRFLLAILVVFIHNNFTPEKILESASVSGAATLFCPNSFTEWIQYFISYGLGSCTFPLFFLFAAYLQVLKSDSYPVLIKKRTKSLVIPYFIWIGIYLVYQIFGKLIISRVMPSVLAHPDNIVSYWGWKDWLHYIFGYGKTNNNPLAAGQFWFLRDLIILVFISPVLKYLIRKYPKTYFLVISIFYFSGIQVYFVQTEALFFYSLGLYWGILDFDLFNFVDNMHWTGCSIVFLFILIRTKYFPVNIFILKIIAISSAFIILKISKFIINKQKLFHISEYLAGFSFFLYAIHMPALLQLLQTLWLHFLPMKSPSLCLFEYFGVTILTILIGTMFGILLRKICPPLFSALNGGRK